MIYKSVDEIARDTVECCFNTIDEEISLFLNTVESSAELMAYKLIYESKKTLNSNTLIPTKDFEMFKEHLIKIIKREIKLSFGTNFDNYVLIKDDIDLNPYFANITDILSNKLETIKLAKYSKYSMNIVLNRAYCKVIPIPIIDEVLKFIKINDSLLGYLIMDDKKIKKDIINELKNMYIGIEKAIIYKIRAELRHFVPNLVYTICDEIKNEKLTNEDSIAI